MPRQGSYEFRETGPDDFAKAGAHSRARISAEVFDQAQQNRIIERDAQIFERQALQDERANKREDRLADSQTLDDEVKRWEFEKTKTLDANALALKKDVDQDAIVANQELRAIKANDPDWDEKYANWEAAHFRVLHPKIGDERVIAQAKLNQELRLGFTKAAEKAAAEKLVREEREAARRGTISADEEGKTRISRPLKEGEVEQIQKDALLKEHAMMEATVNAQSGKPQDPAKIAELNIVKQKLGFDQIAPATGAVVPKAAALAPRIKVNPQTGERITLKDGKWVPL